MPQKRKRISSSKYKGKIGRPQVTERTGKHVNSSEEKKESTR